MGRNSGDARSRGIWLKQLPDNLLTHADALHLAGPVHGSEHVPVSYAGRGSPSVGRHLNPRRHRNRSHAAMFPNKIHYAPAPIPLLDVAYGKRRHFGSAQTATEKDCKDGAIRQTLCLFDPGY